MSAKQGEVDSGWAFFFLAAFIAIMAVALWIFFRIPILEFLRWLRLLEFGIIRIFTDSENACFDWLYHVRLNDNDPSQDVVQWANQCFSPRFLAKIPPKDLGDYFALTGISMAAIEKIATPYIHFPLALIFGGLIFYVLYVSPRNKFKTTHTLESFIKTQAKMWPVITPIVDFNPIKSSGRIPGSAMPDKLPMFAEAMSPEEWISWNRIPVTNGIADREATRRAFLLQLGPRWNGIEGQPPYIQALFAAFAMKGVQRREESDDMLGRLSLCWSVKGGFKMTSELAAEVRKLIKDPNVGGKALEIAAQHAWRTTAILGVLKWARAMGGVLAPAQFLWLRGIDRTLWYALNNLGRRSYHSEGAGAMAHLMAEQNAKKPLPIPRIDTAIVTLNQYLAGSGMPIPPREP